MLLEAVLSLSLPLTLSNRICSIRDNRRRQGWKQSDEHRSGEDVHTRAEGPEGRDGGQDRFERSDDGHGWGVSNTESVCFFSYSTVDVVGGGALKERGMRR